MAKIKSKIPQIKTITYLILKSNKKTLKNTKYAEFI